MWMLYYTNFIAWNTVINWCKRSKCCSFQWNCQLRRINILLHFPNWAPNSRLIGLVEIVELYFVKRTRTGKPSSLFVDKVIEDVQASPYANSSWNNIVEQCKVKLTKGCESLSFENIVKLYAFKRFFISKGYCKHVQAFWKNTLEGLWKQLKVDNEQLLITLA